MGSTKQFYVVLTLVKRATQRLADLFTEWTVDYNTVEAMALIEQLLNVVPEDLHMWLNEKKPTTVAEAGRLADDCTGV